MSLTVRRRAGSTAPRSPCESRGTDRRDRRRTSGRRPATTCSTRPATASLPGLVNGHTHAAMTLIRGYGDDLPLMEWLRGADLAGRGEAHRDDVYWGTRLACVEMIRSGTVRFWDMYWQPDAVARAVRDAGMRADGGPPLVDGLDPTKSGRAARRGRATHSTRSPVLGPRCARRRSGHTRIYTVSEQSLHWIAELSAERDVPVQIHLLRDRRRGARLRRPRTACARRVSRPDRAAHAAHGARARRVARRRRARARRRARRDDRHQPVSNLKLAVGGVFPYAKARARTGSRSGSAPTVPSSNNSLDLLADVKLLALLQKHAERRPGCDAGGRSVGGRDRAARAAAGRAPASRWGSPPTSCSSRRDAPELTPGDLVANLVYAAPGSVVDTTVVAGQVLIRGGEIGDEAEVRAGAIASARRLGVIE